MPTEGSVTSKMDRFIILNLSFLDEEVRKQFSQTRKALTSVGIPYERGNIYECAFDMMEPCFFQAQILRERYNL